MSQPSSSPKRSLSSHLVRIGLAIVAVYGLYQVSLMRCHYYEFRGHLQSFFSAEDLMSECYGWVNDEGAGYPLCSHHNAMLRDTRDSLERHFRSQGVLRN